MADKPFLFFDYLRIPYRLRTDAAPGMPDGLDEVAWGRAPGRRLVWPADHGLADLAGVAGEYRYAGSPIFGRVVPDASLAPALGDGWHPAEQVTDPDGRPAASVWRNEAGAICLPFDPAEAILAFWSEAYLGIRNARHTHGPSLALRFYYRVRPLLPRRIQIAIRRARARFSGLIDFPRWPVEPALHDLLRNLYTVAEEVSGEPIPWIAPWPASYDWAFVLTHDVETADGYARIGELQALESSLGYRSSWNFVPRRYPVEDRVLREVEEAGGEVGLHGLHHDGRDLASAELLEARLPEMREQAARWGAIGFRSPATQRRWDLMPILGFDYDSSYPDTDPYEPQPGGSCSWLPYPIGDMVELPITLPQDHTLYTILKHGDARAWLDKTALVRERGGMALLLSHPDYMIDETARRPYRELLEEYADDPSAWHALPREVSAWWRRRAASDVVRDGDGWRVRGPADGEATITSAPPR